MAALDLLYYTYLTISEERNNIIRKGISHFCNRLVIGLELMIGYYKQFKLQNIMLPYYQEFIAYQLVK